MGYLAEEAVFMPLSKKVLEESDKFTCGNDDLDDFFQNDSIAYAENLFGKTYCFQMKGNVKELLCAFTVSNASIFTMLLPNARKKKVAKNVIHPKYGVTLLPLRGALTTSTYPGRCPGLCTAAPSGCRITCEYGCTTVNNPYNVRWDEMGIDRTHLL